MLLKRAVTSFTINVLRRSRETEFSWIILSFAMCVAFLPLIGCGTGSAASPASITPNAVTLQGGKSQQFRSHVVGNTNGGVIWMVAGLRGGNSTVGTISSNGLYTAPAKVLSEQFSTVTAVSAADGTQFANAVVTIMPLEVPLAVSISPTKGNLQAGQSIQFTAKITGTSDTASTWKVVGAAGGSASVGTITSDGLYTAPTTILAPTSVSIIYQNLYAPSANATVQVTLSPANAPTPPPPPPTPPTSPTTPTTGQFYVSPSGSDANSGTSAASPWRTFAHAIAKLAPGDTLNLENGTYNSSNSGFPQVDCSSGASNGTSSAPITIQAQNERQAHIQNDLTAVPVSISNCSYWNVNGLWVTGKDSTYSGTAPSWYNEFTAQMQCVGCSHVVFYHNLVNNGDRCTNTHMMAFLDGTSNSQMIENEIYSWSRHAFVDFDDPNTSTTGNEFQRNYASKRNYSQIICNNGYSSSQQGDGFKNYSSSYALWENNITEGPVPQGGFGGLTADSADTDTGVQFLGNISLNASAFDQNPHTSTDVISGFNYSNNVVINSNTLGFYIRGSFLNTVDHLSVFTPSSTGCGGQCSGMAQDNDGYGSITPTSTVTSSVVFSNPSSVVGFNIVNGTSTLNYLSSGASAISNDTVSNPLTAQPTNIGSCYLWIPASSNLSAAGSDGTDLGATVLYEYSEGSITATPLWSAASGAFHGGAIVAGINDVAGSSLFDVQSRLNVNQNGCSYPSSYAGW